MTARLLRTAGFVGLLAFAPLAQAQARKPKPAPAPAPATATAEPAQSATPPNKDAPPSRSSKAPAGSAPGAQAPPKVETEESAEGVKTYKFGAVEVEGRLRSPQILYFLRRVRAEFDAGDLGHRSFLLELSDTRRDPVFR